MKKRGSVPGYGPEYTRPGHDPFGVGNNSETLCPAKIYSTFNLTW